VKENLVNSKGRSINLPHGRLSLPLFMPDATFGVVRSVGFDDLVRCGIQAVVMNAFHLMQRPGSSIIETMGGLHSFSSWSRPIVTDSGGFQAYSLIRQNSKFGSLTNKGIVFRPGGSSHKFVLTPEKSIQLQLSYGSDVAICLDDCTHVNEPFESQQESVIRTVEWARRCKVEFEQRIKQRHSSKKRRPLLFAVVQGGGSYDLRRECARSLCEIGFDGYAYGGYPLDSEGNLLADLIKFTRQLIPHEFPMIALGVGEPSNVLKCSRIGYDLFDSSMPTRDARQGRLYRFGHDFSGRVEASKKLYSYLYVKDEKHSRSKEPISPRCDCLTCSNYPLTYLHHLFKIGDALYLRLATIHNLRFMVLLTQRMREDMDEER
jgi:queuine tRNA-ribosyltransferase